MARLEDLTPGARVRGLVPGATVEVLRTTWDCRNFGATLREDFTGNLSGRTIFLVIAVWFVDGLYVGNQDDYELIVKGLSGWAVVHACKEPYHRAALGYRGRGAPKHHSEYLIARRGTRLILNLVDAPDPRFIPQGIIDEALLFIHSELSHGNRVLVHCNEGHSRSPGIAMLYLAINTDAVPSSDYDSAANAFRKLYPA